MSSYTTEVRFICESYAGLDKSVGFSSIDSVVEKAVPRVFDFTFPIFDENYRIPLEKKILKHFYTREICEESVGLWKLRLEETLDEIMPYYNQLYRTQIDNINPYYNIDLKTEHTGKGTKDTDGTNSNTKSGTKNGTTDTSYEGLKEHTITNGTDTTTKGTIKTVNYGGDKITTENGTGNEWNKNIEIGYNTEKEKETTVDQKRRQDVVQTNSSSKNVNRFSDTPQGSLENMEAIEANLYLTTATIDDNVNHTTTNDNEKINENVERNNATTGTKNVSDEYNSRTADQRTKKETFAGRNDKTVNSGSDTTDKYGTKDVIKDGIIREIDSERNSENSSGTKNEKIKTTEDYIEHVSGYKGVKSVAALIMEWRKSLLNIDAMIMKDLEDCFFQLW